MGFEESKKATDKLQKKYEDTFFSYATEGFICTLAECLLPLPSERRAQALNTYPEDIKEKVQAKIRDYFKESWQSTKFWQRDESHIISQENLFTADDYIELENALENLEPEEYETLLGECEGNNPWLANKVRILSNKMKDLPSLNYWQIQNLLQTFDLMDFYNIYTYSSAYVKEFIFSHLSKNNKKTMLEDFSHLSEHKKENYKYIDTIHKINNFMANPPSRY